MTLVFNGLPVDRIAAIFDVRRYHRTANRFTVYDESLIQSLADAPCFASVPSDSWEIIMLVRHSAPDDVVAFTMSGPLRAQEIDRIIAAIEEVLAHHPKVHLFAEVNDPSGVVEAFRGHWRRSLSFMSQLDRFGRIAIVADQAWLRNVARVESAILPNIHYEVYEPGECDHALAWARGEVSSPHAADTR